MSAPTTCCANSCQDVEIVNVPGIEGDAGADGADGIDAFTTTTQNFVVPAVGATVTILVGTSAWAQLGQNIFVEDAGYFEVTALPGASSMTLEYLDYTGNDTVGNTINAGSGVSPGGVEGPGGLAGAGTPEGSATASPGATYLNTTDESFWVKKTGTQTNTGWIQLIAAAAMLLFFMGISAFGQPVIRNQYTTNTTPVVSLLVTNIARSVATNDSIALTTMTNIALVSITNRFPTITNLASYVITNTEALWHTNAVKNTVTNTYPIATNAPGLSAVIHFVDQLAITNQAWFTNGILYVTNRF